MRARRHLIPAVLAVAALAAGCGSDDEGSSGGSGGEPKSEVAGGPKGATAFISCFKAPGYEAKKPKPREESVFAFQAKNKGYEVTPVNVMEKGKVSSNAFLVFFKDADTAKKAIDELEATSVGEVKPAQKGPAVIGYVAAEDRKAFGKQIDACLS